MPDLKTATSTAITALGPLFAVGLAVQHFDELLDPVLTRLSAGNPDRKKTWMGLASLLFGLLATQLMHLRVFYQLAPYGPKDPWKDTMDCIITALIISTGTEGINSIVKFLGYAKDQKKVGPKPDPKSTLLKSKGGFMSIQPSGTLGLLAAGRVCEKAIRSGFSGTITADKALQVLGFPDLPAIENVLIPNLVTFADEEGAQLDPASLALQETTTFGDMQAQVATAPMKGGE